MADDPTPFVSLTRDQVLFAADILAATGNPLPETTLPALIAELGCVVSPLDSGLFVDPRLPDDYPRGSCVPVRGLIYTLEVPTTTFGGDVAEDPQYVDAFAAQTAWLIGHFGQPINRQFGEMPSVHFALRSGSELSLVLAGGICLHLSTEADLALRDVQAEVTWDDLTEQLARVFATLEDWVYLTVRTPEPNAPARVSCFHTGNDHSLLTSVTSGQVASGAAPPFTVAQCFQLDADGWRREPDPGWYVKTFPLPAQWASYQELAQSWVMVLRDIHGIESPDQLICQCWKQGNIAIRFPADEVLIAEDPHRVALSLPIVPSTYD